MQLVFNAMSDRGKGGRGASSEKRKSAVKSAGLIFPVGRIGRHLREGRYAKRVGAVAPLVLAAILEYVCAELLLLAGECCMDDKKFRITPRHIQFAIHNDEELSKLLADVSISSGGVIPYVDPFLLPKQKTLRDGHH